MRLTPLLLLDERELWSRPVPCAGRALCQRSCGPAENPTSDNDGASGPVHDGGPHSADDGTSSITAHLEDRPACPPAELRVHDWAVSGSIPEPVRNSPALAGRPHPGAPFICPPRSAALSRMLHRSYGGLAPRNLSSAFLVGDSTPPRATSMPNFSPSDATSPAFASMFGRAPCVWSPMHACVPLEPALRPSHRGPH